MEEIAPLLVIGGLWFTFCGFVILIFNGRVAAIYVSMKSPKGPNSPTIFGRMQDIHEQTLREGDWSPSFIATLIGVMSLAVGATSLLAGVLSLSGLLS